MKKTLTLIAVLISAVIFTGTASFADSGKIGVVNFETIIKDSSAGKLNQKELKAKFEKLQTKLEAEKQKVEEMNAALERESLVLSAEKKRDRQRELRDKVSDLKKMNSDFSEEMQIEQNKRFKQMEKEVFEITNAYGKANGFLLIVEKKTAGVIYTGDTVDITDQIITEYNAKFSKK